MNQLCIKEKKEKKPIPNEYKKSQEQTIKHNP